MRLPLIKLLTASVIGAFFFAYGMFISFTVLRQVDLCSLLATGRWIVQHHALPHSDPFSWSYIYFPVPHVVEKWLTDVVFYAIQQTTGAIGLQLFSSSMIVIAFFVLPVLIGAQLKIPRWQGVLLAMIPPVISLTHLNTRPELFSFCFADVWLMMLVRIESRTGANTQIDRRAVLWLSGLTVLWTNLHTLFPLGIFLLALYDGIIWLVAFFKLDKPRPWNWTVTLAALSCSVATLCNPYGTLMLQNLPIVLGDCNDLIAEMQPLYHHVLRESSAFFYYPYLFQALLGIILLVRGGINFPRCPNNIFFRILFFLGFYAGVQSVRAVPLGGLFMSASAMYLLKEKPLRMQKFATGVAAEVQKVLDIRTSFIATAAVIITLLGTFLTSFVIVPQIPQPHSILVAPTRALAFLRENPPSGRQFNELAYGAVEMWQNVPNSPIFFDPRIYVYGKKLLIDYIAMLRIKAGWRELLDKYQIDWVFVPRTEPIAAALAHQTGWKKLYEDDLSVVWGRNQH